LADLLADLLADHWRGRQGKAINRNVCRRASTALGNGSPGPGSFWSGRCQAQPGNMARAALRVPPRAELPLPNAGRTRRAVRAAFDAIDNREARESTPWFAPLWSARIRRRGPRWRNGPIAGTDCS